MKKHLAILFPLCMLLTLLGCSKNPNNATIESTIQDTTASAVSTTTAVDLPLTQKPMSAVSVPTVTEVTAAEDGTEVFRYVYQNMALVVPDQEVADNVIIDFLNRVDKSLIPADDIRQQALSAYTGPENWVPYLYTLTYSPTRIDQGVLSLYGTNIIYSGSSHPTYNCVSVNYDLITGSTLTLGSILQHADKLTTLEGRILDALDAISVEKQLRKDYIDTVHTRFAGEESYDEDWFLTPTGLCFYFPPYEIAPYSSGIIVVEIPYNQLVGVISDAYFPAEHDATSGNILIQPIQEAEITKFTQIGELILTNNGGEKLLLSTDSFIQNPRITVAFPTTGETYTAFASQYLTPGDAIMIETTVENLANLSLLYEENGKTVTVPLAAH